MGLRVLLCLLVLCRTTTTPTTSPRKCSDPLVSFVVLSFLLLCQAQHKGPQTDSKCVKVPRNYLPVWYCLNEIKRITVNIASAAHCLPPRIEHVLKSALPRGTFATDVLGKIHLTFILQDLIDRTQGCLDAGNFTQHIP